MKKYPLISVIVPVYNVEPYLRKCVRSICEQDYSNLEIVLVNDGSTDFSGNICDELREKDSRIKVIHKENGGLSDARNAGLDCTKGRYLTFIDSDDWVSKDYISSLYKLIAFYNCQVSIGSSVEVSEKEKEPEKKYMRKKRIRKCFNNEETIEALLYQKDFTTAAWGKLYDVNLWKNIRFPLNRLFEDVITVFEVLAKSNRVAVSNQIIYFYLQRSDSIVRDRFDIRKMDYVYNMKEVLTQVKKKYPRLEDAAVSRLLWADIHLLIHMDDSERYKKQHEELWKDVRDNRARVIKDTKSRYANKVVAVLSYGGDKVLKYFFKLYKK